MEIEEYRKLPISEFIQSYENMLMQQIGLIKRDSKLEVVIADDIKESIEGVDFFAMNEIAAEIGLPKGGEEEFLSLVEIEFINHLLEYYNRRTILLYDYSKHCLKIGKSSNLIHPQEIDIHVHFLEKKLEATRTRIDILKLKEKLSTFPAQPQPKTKRNKLNICERYIVAQKTIGLWDDMINKMDIRLAENKYVLLASILGIDDTNARKVVAGTYDCKVDPKKIDDFINSLYQ